MNSTTTAGASFFLVIFIVFMTLIAKIGVVANWSWWTVTLPLWSPLALGVTLFFVFLIIGLIAHSLKRGPKSIDFGSTEFI